MKRGFCLLVAIVLLLSLPLVVFAHSGRTDSSGGHYDRSTGEYHYHHGYPAHQHTNGYCPYNFDDKTDHGNYNGGDGSGGSNENSGTNEGVNNIHWSGIVGIVLFFSLVPGAVLGFLIGSVLFWGIVGLSNRLLSISKIAHTRIIKRLSNVSEKVRRFCFLFVYGFFVVIPSVFFIVMITKWMISL